MSNTILLITVMQTRLCLSRKKVENKMNKCLTKWLALICKFTHFPFSTKSSKHIFLLSFVCYRKYRLLTCIYRGYNNYFTCYQRKKEFVISNATGKPNM